MKKNLILLSLLTFVVMMATLACRKTPTIPNAVPVLPETPYFYAKASIHSPYTNKLTDWGATLGRVLFYDKKLSLNNNIACASCHHESTGFAESTAFSLGFIDGQTGRNSLAIIDESHRFEYFWDSRVTDLEEMVMKPIQHKVEMGFTDLNLLATKLQMVEYYPELFNKAFGTTTITQNLISKALAQFVRSLQSDDSKFDQGKLVQFSNFTAEEQLGKTLFMNTFTCNSCHTLSITPTSGNDSTTGGGYNSFVVNANVGLDENYADNGVGSLISDPNHNGEFRIPNLKNNGFTAPYMHDGRFKTLSEVLDHYSTGIKAHPNLHFFLRNPDGTPVKFNMTEQEKSALIAFLHTLDDPYFINDPKFSNPFRAQ